MTLITRPRRFGKTLNMSMLECFFSNKYADRVSCSRVFPSEKKTERNKYRELQGTFSVMFLSFANIKAKNYADMEYKITEETARVYEQNSYLLEGSLLSTNEQKYYESIKPGIGESVV